MRRKRKIAVGVLIVAVVLGVVIGVVVSYAAGTVGQVISNVLTATITVTREPVSPPSGPSGPSGPSQPVSPPVLEPFSDTRGHWAEQAITDMATLGIIAGYPDGTFKPDGSVTRAEFSKMVVLTLGLEVDKGSEIQFTDDIPAWAKPYVRSAVAMGYFRGYPDGTFRPNDRITRQEIAVVLARVVDGAPIALAFIDAKDIAAWAYEAVGQVVAEGLVKGYPDGRFLPRSYVTRAEGCMVLWRLTSD